MALSTRSLTWRSSVPTVMTLGTTAFSQGTTFTAAFWFKRTAAGIGNAQNIFYFGSNGAGVVNYTVANFLVSNRIEVYSNSNSQSFCADFVTNQQITDNLWHHCCIQISTAISVEIDGVSSPQSSFGNISNYQVLDYGTWSIGGGNAATVGAGVLDCELDLFYISENNYPANRFRSSTGQPIAFTGSFGAGGFLLNFDNNSSLAALGTDTSGNVQTWTPSGFVLGTDSTTDVPGGIAINPIPFSASGTLAVDTSIRKTAQPTAPVPFLAGGGFNPNDALISVRTTRKTVDPITLAPAGKLVGITRQTMQASAIPMAASGGLAMNPPQVTIAIDPHSARAMLSGSGTMGAAGSVLTRFMRLSLDILNRVKMLIPGRWFAWAAPMRDMVLGGIADGAAWCSDWITYARAQSRLATATGIWLDIFCFDYLRRYLLRRGSSDDVFRAKIRATILQERVTRKGMINAITQLTGAPPWIFEPWNTGDAGGWGTGLFALNRHGGWGSIQLPGQIFMQINRAGVGPTGVPNVAGLVPPGQAPGLGGYSAGQGFNAGAIEYIGSAVAQIGITDPDIYQIIDSTKPTGTTVWTQID